MPAGHWSEPGQPLAGAAHTADPPARPAILVVGPSRPGRAQVRAMLAPLDRVILESTGGARALAGLAAADLAAIVVHAVPSAATTGPAALVARVQRRFRGVPMVVLTPEYDAQRWSSRGDDESLLDRLALPVNPGVLLARVSLMVDLSVKTGQLTLALETVARQERLAHARQLRQITALELLRLAHGAPDAEAVITGAAQVLSVAMGSSMARVMKVNDAGDVLSVVASVGFVPDASRHIPRNAESLEWQALASDTPVSLVGGGRPGVHAADDTVASAAGVRVGPLDRPYGVVVVADATPRSFSTDEIQFLHLIATVLSVAVQRARSVAQRRDLLANLVSAQEEERSLIASDIHDDAVQVMTAASMRLQLFLRMVSDPAILAAGAKLERTIGQSIERLRSLLFQLTPPALERSGLVAAIEGHLDRLLAESGIRCDLQTSIADEPCHDSGIAIFRVFQEAIANLRKHAHVDRFTLTLNVDAADLVMVVSDLGNGFESGRELAPGHIGLASMAGRMHIAGGALDITSAPGRGTTVVARVPMERNRALDPSVVAAGVPGLVP